MSSNEEEIIDSGSNFDDFRRQPENFGKNVENNDRIVFPDELERISPYGVSNSEIEESEEKNGDDGIVFPDELEKMSLNVVSNNGVEESEEKKEDDRIVFPDELEKMNDAMEESEEKVEDDRIVFPDDGLLNVGDKSATGIGDNGNFDDYIRDPSNFGINEKNKPINESTLGDNENFDDYIRHPENFRTKEENGGTEKEN